MLLFTMPPVFVTILLIFGIQENSCQERECQQHECQAHQTEPWSYEGNNGPENWNSTYPDCDNTKQSPINIIHGDTYTDRSLILNINYVKAVESATIENNGHTVQITPTDGIQRWIEVDDSSTQYLLSQIHFHWVCDSTPNCGGSEHQLNGKYSPIEMHAVHESSDGKYAVIGVLFHESSKLRNNTALNPITESLPLVRYKGQKTDIVNPPLDLEKLLCTENNCFYRYEGSLTTPPCTEGVTWTVYRHNRKISKVQMEEFRRVLSTEEKEDEKCQMCGNYRPLQALNGRTVGYKQKKVLG